MRYQQPKNCVASSRKLQVLGASALVSVFMTGAASMAQAQEVPAVGAVRAYDFTATASASESYVSNASGLAGGSSDSFISTIGIGIAFHERTRTFSLDANYNFGADFYANGGQPTQISNNLAAIGDLAAIPGYLTIVGKAFASPVILNNAAIVTAGNRVVSNGYSNSYGYSVGPDLRFHVSDVLVSDSTASYGGAFFSAPAGSVPLPPIPGLQTPQDTTNLYAMQSFSSGEYFERLNWSVGGTFTQTREALELLDEKAGALDLRYAINHEFSLLGTVGYDALTYSDIVPPHGHLSGLVALGGFAVTLGENFSASVQAGQKFNSPSVIGSLHYNLSPRAMIVGSATDVVTTPGGQLIDNLTNLLSTPNGGLTTSGNQYADGTPASPPFNPQTPGIGAYNNNITRYQNVSLSFLEDFERNHAGLMFYGSRQTTLSGIFIGPATTENWGGQLTLSRNISERTVGSVGGSYEIDQEFGGNFKTFRANAALNYVLSRQMNVSLQANYVDRLSPATLAAKPIVGNLSDYEIMIAVSRTLWP